MDNLNNSLGTLKRGNTFAYTAQLTDESGEPIAGAAGRLRAQVRSHDDTLLTTLIVTETETPGSYLFASPTSTKNWGVYVLTDIEYTEPNGSISSSETLTLTMVEAVTRDG